MSQLLGSIEGGIEGRMGSYFTYSASQTLTGRSLVEIMAKNGTMTGLAEAVLDRLEGGPEGARIKIANLDAVKDYRVDMHDRIEANKKEQGGLTATQTLAAMEQGMNDDVFTSIHDLWAASVASGGEMFEFSDLYDMNDEGITGLQQMALDIAGSWSERTGISLGIDTSKPMTDGKVTFRSPDPRLVGRTNTFVVDFNQIHSNWLNKRIVDAQGTLRASGMEPHEAWAAAHVSENGSGGQKISKMMDALDSMSGEMFTAEVARAAAEGISPDDMKLVTDFDDLYKHWKAAESLRPGFVESRFTGDETTMRTDMLGIYDLLRSNREHPMSAADAYETVAKIKSAETRFGDPTGMTTWTEAWDMFAADILYNYPHLNGQHLQAKILQNAEYLFRATAITSAIDVSTHEEIFAMAAAMVTNHHTFIGGTYVPRDQHGISNANIMIPRLQGLFGETNANSTLVRALRLGHRIDGTTDEQHMEMSIDLADNWDYPVIFEPMPGQLDLWQAKIGTSTGLYTTISPSMTVDQWGSYLGKVSVAMSPRGGGGSLGVSGWQEGMVDPRIQMTETQELLTEQGDPFKGLQFEQINPITAPKPGDMTPQP